MSNKKTVFILGAGSSAEFGMSTGEKLKGEIIDLLAPGAHGADSEQTVRFRNILINMDRVGSQCEAELTGFGLLLSLCTGL